MADAITIKALQDASLDAKSLEEVVNGGEEKQVTTRKGETYPSVKKAIKTLFENGGLPATPFATKALMVASALVDGKYAIVTDDIDSNKNGYYQKQAGSWKYLRSNIPADKIMANRGEFVGASLDLNTLYASGYYILRSAKDNPNIPADFTSVLAYIEVRAYSNYVIQNIHDRDTGVSWTRVARPTGEVYAWAKSPEIAFRGEFVGASLDLNTLYKEGNYLLRSAKDNPNIPADFTTVLGYLDVVNYGNYIIQNIHDRDTGASWTRVVKPTGEVYAWTKTAGVKAFKGTKAVFLGDSITAQGDYPTRVGVNVGFEAVNGGVSGSQLTQQADSVAGMSGVDMADAISTGDWTAMQAIGGSNAATVSRLATVDWLEVDYVVCFWGTNDYAANVPIGLDTDNNRTTVKGAANYVNTKIMTKYPHIKILWVTPMFRARTILGDNKDSDSFANANGDYLYELGDAIAKVAERYSVPVLDLYRKSNVNKLNHAHFLRDGLHPVAGIGYDHLSNKVAAAIKSNF